ncbi:MAG TPA: TIGR00159 family protein [Ruminococcaceae bacterium]|nr:TIGR00159 family protein [Oscillospiraceae bacterium]
MEYLNQIKDFFIQAGGVVSSFRVSDLLDILLVAFVFYSAVKLVRETRAIQLLKGIILFVVIYFFISLFEMQASTYLFHSVASNALLFIVIIFTPEIRHALESMGRNGLAPVVSFGRREREKNSEKINGMITQVCRSVSSMSEKKIGALIVFERNTLLGSIIETGTVVDAATTQELIGTIFFPKTPLHDGAAIIRNDRVIAAGCILPLTKNNEINKELGTRHRAAIGISEESDAVVVVVSEETGYISIIEKGVIYRDITSAELRERLQSELISNFGDQKPSVVSRIVERVKGKRKGGEQK